MTATSTAVGADLVVAHGLHVAMVLAGLWGLAALLLPHVLTRCSLTLDPAADHTADQPDDHATRVAALRVAVGSGGASDTRPAAPVDTPATGSAGPRPAPLASNAAPAALGLPLAVVATATAAGIHAAVAPPHLREGLTTGLFLLAVAALQLAWAAAATRPTPRLLRTGVALHLSLVALWLLTRTTGLPAALATVVPDVDLAAHPVGAWDLACVAWQLAAAAACVATLRRGVPDRCPGWFAWPPSSRAAVGAAATGLVLLSTSGLPS